VGEIQRYMNRLSGPLLDRIDIHVDVPGPPDGGFYVAGCAGLALGVA